MKWLKRILLSIVVLVAIAAIVGFFLPTDYAISREATINATPEKIHEHVGDLAKWEAWTPWLEADPTIVVTGGGKTSGIGASQSWTGDSGNGSLTFTKSSPTEGIEYDLLFDPGGKCKAAMRYESAGSGQTKVLWSMDGDMEQPIIGGYFALMMDSMAGTMFESGLTKLKTVVENQ